MVIEMSLMLILRVELKIEIVNYIEVVLKVGSDENEDGISSERV